MHHLRLFHEPEARPAKKGLKQNNSETDKSYTHMYIHFRIRIMDHPLNQNWDNYLQWINHQLLSGMTNLFYERDNYVKYFLHQVSTCKWDVTCDSWLDPKGNQGSGFSPTPETLHYIPNITKDQHSLHIHNPNHSKCSCLSNKVLLTQLLLGFLWTEIWWLFIMKIMTSC